MGLDNPIHIAFVLILVLLVFGAKRVPEMGRSLGSGMRGFKEAITGETPHAAAETGSQQIAPATLVAEQHVPGVAPSAQPAPAPEGAEKLVA